MSPTARTGTWTTLSRTKSAPALCGCPLIPSHAPPQYPHSAVAERVPRSRRSLASSRCSSSSSSCSLWSPARQCMWRSALRTHLRVLRPPLRQYALDVSPAGSLRKKIFFATPSSIFETYREHCPHPDLIHLETLLSVPHSNPDEQTAATSVRPGQPFHRARVTHRPSVHRPQKTHGSL